MPCAVTLAKSPMFTPSPRASPIFCKPISALLSPSPSSSSPCPSPISPFTLRLHKQQQQPPPPVINLINASFEAEDLSTDTTTTLFKRKRPARIDVPLTSLSFEAMVRTAKGTDGLLDDVVEVDEERYGVYCKRGKRGVMEDRFSALVGIRGDSNQAFFAVFDGHGGSAAAEYAAHNMERNIINQVEVKSEKIEEAVKEGYLTTDAEFLKQEKDGGTCSVTALIRQGVLVVSNAGDCRAVMSREGVAEALTVDHRPSREDERERIQSMGGYVDCCRGVWRIQGSLAVSRGIGDRHLKRWVIAEPDTKILRIRAECEFLILASDGLWDKVANQEAVDVVRPLCTGVDNPDAVSACKKLVELSMQRGSNDDISVMVIQLGRFIQ